MIYYFMIFIKLKHQTKTRCNATGSYLVLVINHKMCNILVIFSFIISKFPTKTNFCPNFINKILLIKFCPNFVNKIAVLRTGARAPNYFL